MVKKLHTGGIKNKFNIHCRRNAGYSAVRNILDLNIITVSGDHYIDRFDFMAYYRDRCILVRMVYKNQKKT